MSDKIKIKFMEYFKTPDLNWKQVALFAIWCVQKTVLIICLAWLSLDGTVGRLINSV